MPREPEPKAGGSGSARSGGKDSQSVPTTRSKDSNSASRPANVSSKDRDEASTKRQLKIVTKAPTDRTVEMRASFKDGVSTNKKEVFENVCDWENSEAKSLDVDEHLTRNLEMCAELEVIMARIHELKTSGKSDTEEYSETRIQGLMLLTKLRRMNRLFKLRLKNAKEEILQQRQEVDSDHLLLQNLLYEATHLNNQVLAVQDYKGMDEKIKLIPVEQFYQQAPTNVSKPELTKKDPYQLRIARLEFEFIQRQKLTEQIKELEKSKKDISEHITQQKANLNSIRPLLNSILEATKPAQKFFRIDLSDRKVMYNLAKFLPTPLYILYSSSTGYENSSPRLKERFHASVGGDMEAAKELEQHVQSQAKDEVDSESDMDVDVDEATELEESETRKLRKRSSVFETKEDPKQKLIQKHPLWVEWEVINEKSGDRITIQFYYLTKLGITTVKSKLEIKDESGNLTEIKIQSDNVLTKLFPRDTGVDSPNPSTIFMLQKLDLENFSEFVEGCGRPYWWAQKLCGFNFLPSVVKAQASAKAQQTKPEKTISTTTFPTTFKLIRKRLINQTKLWHQLKTIESKTIRIPAEARDMFPAKNSSAFVSWEPIDWPTFKATKFSKQMVEWKHSTETNIYFKAEFERGRAKLKALVTIDLDFPRTAPVFTIQLEQGSVERNAETDLALLDIERELNYFAPLEFSQWEDTMLSLQLLRLSYCMDVLLETDTSAKDSDGPSEFAREKMFLNPSRGKNFRRPFKYIPNGSGYFAHRY